MRKRVYRLSEHIYRTISEPNSDHQCLHRIGYSAVNRVSHANLDGRRLYPHRIPTEGDLEMGSRMIIGGLVWEEQCHRRRIDYYFVEWVEEENYKSRSLVVRPLNSSMAARDIWLPNWT